jgi:hypothetical protein
MLKEFQNSNGVAFGQSNPFVARHDLLCGGNGSAHDERRQIQPFVGSGGGEKTLLFA